MVRKRPLVAVLLLLIVSAVFAPVAAAQDRPECRIVIEAAVDEGGDAGAPVETETSSRPTDCAEPSPYPGPFVDNPVIPAGPLGWGVLDVVLVPAPADAEPEAADAEVTDPVSRRSPIAHTGTQSFLLAYVGTGLVAFGAAVLGTRRRYFVDDER